MSDSDTSKSGQSQTDKDEQPLADSQMGDKDSGGQAGQGGMRDQDKTSDDGKFRPS